MRSERRFLLDILAVALVWIPGTGWGQFPSTNGNGAVLEHAAMDLWAAAVVMDGSDATADVNGPWGQAGFSMNANGATGEFGAILPLINQVAEPTPTPSATSEPSATSTSTPSPTATQTEIAPPTATPSPTGTIDSASPTATPTVDLTATPTRTFPPGGCDSGYYVLDSLGGRHRVGNPIQVMGPLYFGNDIARDMERAVCDIASTTHEDLIVLDGLGAAHFVQSSACDIMQDFYFGVVATVPEGRAVDIEVTATGRGFWVLSDFGGIYRAGDAKAPAEDDLLPNTDQSGVLGYDISLTGDLRDDNLPEPGGASLHAVSLAVVRSSQDGPVIGFVVLDSMGGRYHYLPDGTQATEGASSGAPENDPSLLLDPAGYVWPFFPGLDIARDMELHPIGSGVVILDGWDGIHPVPVDVESNPVFFARNVISNATPDPVQAVGLPYITAGFDDPSTDLVDESNTDEFGFDASSIFKDLEFSAGCADGLYTLDRFGGVFALGSVRASEAEPVPGFGNSPYFFPLLYAEDMEFFAGNEAEPGGESKFSLFGF